MAKSKDPAQVVVQSPTLGLGNFHYTIHVEDGQAKFHFFDPEDPDNTADVEVDKSDFPQGITDATSRQVADLAFSHCAKVLNDARDDRIRRQAAADLSAKHAEDARQREAAADFHNNSQELANTTPTGGQPPAPKEQKAPRHNENPQDSVEDDSVQTPEEEDK